MNPAPDMASPVAPLAGLKVVEFTHMVMGPSAGLILADLGAETLKIEPLGGDATRRLRGSGAGYFAMFNRNKESLCLDLKSVSGLQAARLACTNADVVIENFRPGAMEKLGLGYDDLAKINAGLIYCSAKGFLSGAYEHRAALDEVAQMMGGLAYMTGPPGRPLRAGASVVDINGGMFGVIGILAALHRRQSTGRGCEVRSSLFETAAFLVGQHIAQHAVTGVEAAPMPARVSAWAVYDVFSTRLPDQQVFVGVVSDSHWRAFCAAFDLTDWAADPAYDRNNDRVAARDRLIPRIASLFAAFDRPELCTKLERAGLPFAPVARPDDLLEDPHLCAGGGLVDVTLEGGRRARLPALPLEMDGVRFGVHKDLPDVGGVSAKTLALFGFSEAQQAELGAKSQAW